MFFFSRRQFSCKNLKSKKNTLFWNLRTKTCRNGSIFGSTLKTLKRCSREIVVLTHLVFVLRSVLQWLITFWYSVNKLECFSQTTNFKSSKWKFKFLIVAVRNIISKLRPHFLSFCVCAFVYESQVNFVEWLPLNLISKGKLAFKKCFWDDHKGFKSFSKWHLNLNISSNSIKFLKNKFWNGKYSQALVSVSNRIMFFLKWKYSRSKICFCFWLQKQSLKPVLLVSVFVRFSCTVLNHFGFSNLNGNGGWFASAAC